MTQEQVDTLDEATIERECQESDTRMALILVPCTEVITTVEDANRLSKDAAEIARVRKGHEDRWNIMVSRANAEHKRLCSRRKTFLDKYIIAEESRLEKVDEWREQETRRRAEAQAKADEEARQEAVAQALADDNEKLAKQIIKGIVPVSAPEVIAEPVKVVGRAYTTVKKGKVVDKGQFVRACMAGTGGLTLELLVVDEKRLNDLVKATGGTVAYPGVQVYDETISRGTGR